jgi:SNF2-related domain/Helicase conserved C-terminal domain
MIGFTMAKSVAQVQSKRLRRQRTPADDRLYRAALEWGLSEPLLIAGASDFRSEQRWRGQIDPSPYHLANVMTFCQQVPAALLADEAGLDNSISAGLLASELIARGRAAKMLVVCPKILTAEWRHLLETQFRIPAQVVVGRDLMHVEPAEIGAVITTYHSAWLYLDQIPQDRFDLLVLDEVDKLRRLVRNLRGIDQPAHIPGVFRDALERRQFRYALMMTTRPIQNSLWDIYYLIDLLAAARGHVNPFGSENAFALRFIADKREEARALQPQAQQEFHSIVLRYVSRCRRDDVKLSFPDRIVQWLPVEPNIRERDLIAILAKPLQNLEPSAQIALLFALTSSPNAVLAQVNAMTGYGHGAVPEDIRAAVHNIVSRMPLSAKLEGLTTIINRLRLATPEQWRIVVFTGSDETQSRIQIYLEGRGIPVGVVSDPLDPRDQQTLARFRSTQPELRVIICTDQNSESLEVPPSTSVINYDLPWDPLIAERRIRRLRRQWLSRAKLNIFNITLADTFEAQIVGRLMSRLQAACRSMADLSPLLHSAGLGSDDDGDTGLDGWLLQLVLAALAGKEIDPVTRQIEQNIAAAKIELVGEEKNTAALFGDLMAAENLRSRQPELPPMIRSMDAAEFAAGALESLGARVTLRDGQIYLSDEDGAREFVAIEDGASTASGKAVAYTPGTRAFAQLVSQVSATGFHQVDDLDKQAEKQASEIAQRWVSDFGANFGRVELLDACRNFAGRVLVQVRATVANDGYERLVEIPWSGKNSGVWSGRAALAPLADDIQDSATVGIDSEALFQAAIKDPAIAEFSRFYRGRRQQEVPAAGGDAERRKKLANDFTPQFAVTLLGLRGAVHRQIKLRVHYKWDQGTKYSSMLTVAPCFGTVLEAPPMERCAQSGHSVPEDCLARCEITGAMALRHLLVQSHISGRLALRESTIVCSLSKQRILLDEAELSDASDQIVARSLLKSSAVSGKLGEPQRFAQCEFTYAEALVSELGVSELSGKRYRLDEELRSVVSGKVGHRSEFTLCEVTQQPFAPGEGQNCEITGFLVEPSVLMRCAVSGKVGIPSELEQCAASGNWALKKYFVTSSVSGARLLERYALRSAKGKFCTPVEAGRCMWSGRKYHPEDLRSCALTGVSVHFKFVTSDAGARLRPLADLLYGMRRTADAFDLWETIAAKASAALGGGRCRLEAAQTSPDGRHLAVCSEVRSLFGRSVQQAGLIYSFSDDQIIGRIAVGTRSPRGWTTAAG